VSQQPTRKTVTVVFADLADSTTLTESLDPEAMRAILTRYFDTMKAALERHGGIVEKFIGDAVMAVFGVPIVHEDDALRAVRATREMQDKLTELNTELEANQGVTLALRIGVNTGEVVAADSVTAPVTGETVNIAARLESAARPGEILIGHTTMQLVRHAVQVAEPIRFELKGLRDAVTAAPLLGVLPDAPGHARRLESPLVGRAEELAELVSLRDRATSERRCHLVTVLGAAGVGKSRLVLELLDGARYAVGRCRPYEETLDRPVLEIIRALAGIQDDDSEAEVRERLRRIAGGQPYEDAVVDGLASIVGVGDEEPPPLEESFWAIRKLIEAAADPGPLVVVVEDIHWAEPTLLDLIEYLADRLSGPVLIVCLARHHLLESRAGWGGSRPNAHLVRLEPLSSTHTRTLTTNLLDGAELDHEVRDRIVKAAGGVPLFVEEILAMLVEEGTLRRSESGWVPTTDVDEIEIPLSIQTLLAARLDQLSNEERQVIQPASVIGKLFYWSAVRELVPADLQGNVGGILSTLVLKDMIRPAPSDFMREDAFGFRHALLMEAAYRSTPKEVRAESHAGYADWLERASAGRGDEYSEVVGHHLERACRNRLEVGRNDETTRDLALRAARSLRTAGRRALARGDMAAASRALETAANLPSGDAALRAATMADLGRALSLNGRFGRAAETLEVAAKLAREAGDRLTESHARIEAAYVRVETDTSASVTEILTTVSPAMATLEELGDDAGLARGWLLAAAEPWVQCRAAATEAALEHALAHALRAGNRRTESEVLDWLARVSLWGPGHVSAGLSRCENIRTGERTDVQTTAVALFIEAHLRAYEGSFATSRELWSRARDLIDEFGLGTYRSHLAATAGDIAYLAGDFEDSRDALRIGYEIVQEMQETGQIALMSALLAHAAYRCGDFDEAESLALTAQATASPGDVGATYLLSSVSAKLHARRGDHQRASSLIETALETVSATDFINEHADVLMDAAHVYRVADDERAASDAIDRAVQLYELKGNVVSLRGAKESRA
jgi:class 3 adenylate cyclase/tetratricopeptide (TPR) repeat protein